MPVRSTPGNDYQKWEGASHSHILVPSRAEIHSLIPSLMGIRTCRLPPGQTVLAFKTGLTPLGLRNTNTFPAITKPNPTNAGAVH